METTSFGMLMMMLFSFGTANEMLDLVHSPSYWQQSNTPMTMENMVAVFEAPAEIDTSEVPQLIAALGADHFRERKDATKALQAIGEPARPFLEKAATHDDPEISSRSRKLLEGLPSRQPATAMRRLMALRTLGELKDEKALSAVEALLDSDEPFVAQYADLAARRIRGEAVRMPAMKHQAGDLALLQPKTSAVGQMLVHGDPDWHVAQLFEMPMFGGAAEKDELFAEMTRSVSKAIEQLGNIRLDQVTIGLTENIFQGKGAMVLVLRGQLDAKKFVPGMKQLNPRMEVEEINGQATLVVENEMRLIPISDSLVVMVAAEKGVRQIARDVINTVKNKHIDLQFGDALIKQLTAVDQTRPTWMVVDLEKTLPAMDPPFKGLQTFQLTSQAEGDGMLVQVALEAADAATAEAVGGLVKGQVKEMITQVEQGAGFFPGGAKTIKTLKSLKIEQDGARVSGQLEADRNAGPSLLMPLMFFGRMPQRQMQQLEIQEQLELQRQLELQVEE